MSQLGIELLQQLHRQKIELAADWNTLLPDETQWNLKIPSNSARPLFVTSLTVEDLLISSTPSEERLGNFTSLPFFGNASQWSAGHPVDPTQQGAELLLQLLGNTSG